LLAHRTPEKRVVAEDESQALVQVGRCGCRIECFTVDDSQVSGVAVIVSQNYQFQHYTHFHEAKIESSRTGRGQMLEAESEAEDKILAWRTAWPRGLILTSLAASRLCYCAGSSHLELYVVLLATA